MMENGHLHADVYIYSESEESDQESIPLNSRIPFEDLPNEIDVARYYRRLCSDDIYSHNPHQRSRRSVPVQTDPDTANVPPSWLLVGERLVDELYTGLGNLINTTYHNPESHIKQEAMRRACMNPTSMKYFTYENGHWQSTLLPNVKIPALSGIDSQHPLWPLRALCSDDTKRSLHRLLDVATKLKNVVSYTTNCVSLPSPRKVEEKTQYCCNENSLGELKRTHSTGGGAESPDHDVETESDSGKSSAYSPEYCEEEHITKRVKKLRVEGTAIGGRVLDDSCWPDQIPGVKVSGCNKPVHASTPIQRPNQGQKLCIQGVKVESFERKGSSVNEKTLCARAPPESEVLASCSNDCNNVHKSDKIRSERTKGTIVNPNEKKRALFMGNYRKNILPLGGGQKNFIRKNIMDLKMHSNRVVTDAVRKNLVYDSKSRETSQRSHRAASPYPRGST